MKRPPVSFDRGVPGYPVPEHRVYRSKCGRFKIERRTYVAPFVSIGYEATDEQTGRGCRSADTLAEAKLWCCWKVDPSYDPEPLQ